MTAPQAALLLAALLPLAAHARRIDSPTTARAEKNAREALSNARSPRSAASLIRLHALRDEVDDLNLLADPYARFLRIPGAQPQARAVARMFYADVTRARGQHTKARAMLAPLGFIDQFYVVGAFDNEGKTGCDTPWGPEGAQLSLDAKYPTKQHEVGWRKLPAAAPNGFVDLGAVVRPNTEAVAYALTFLEMPSEGPVTFALGTSGAFRLYVDGQLAASEDRYNQPRPDQARVSVRLPAGVHRVLLKVCQDAGALGFYLRQESGRGRVLLPNEVPALPKKVHLAAQRLPTLTSALEKEVRAKPDDAALRSDYSSVLAYFRAFDAPSRLDVAEMERAVERKKNDAELQMLAAVRQDDHNLQRKHLEAALRLTPDEPYARLMLAQLELELEHPAKALALLTPLVDAHPQYAAAIVAKARALEALGEWPKSVELIEASFRAMPFIPSLAREAARVSRRFDRLQETLERTRTALALRADDTSSRRVLASLLADLGRIDEAAAQLEQTLALDPFDLSSRLKLAELFAANGKQEEALKAFADARELSADDPEVHEREGRALLQLGDRQTALASFARSLALRPQNPTLKEVVRSLEGESSPIGTQYVLDWKPLVPEADAFAGEDAVYLVDYAYSRVQPSGQSSRFHQMAVKVYTQRGVDAFRSYPITYAPTRQEVRILKARLTKPDGSIVDSYAEGERNINEPWTGMYYDARAKVLSFPALAAGDVLELQYRLDDTAKDNLLSDYWGDVDYVQAAHPKVRYQYLVDMPAQRKLYWNSKRLPENVTARTEPEQNGRVLYRFTSAKVPKVVPEPSMPGWAEVATTLHVSTYRDWEQVNRYYWGLIRDQLTPNEELKRTVDQALAGVDRKDELAVVRAIYNFVVTHTRYVALEFGIHGYKPYRVDRVLARRFGDCKDKASLIHAMLKVAGVDSRLVLLRMRHLGNIGEEPASLAAFNHAIAYVPKFQLWLDGTAEFHSTTELPSADRLANVLVIEPDGPTAFATTPEAKPEENLTVLHLDVALQADGKATVTGKSSVRGQSAPDYRRTYQAQATRKQTFEQGWAQLFPGLTVKKVEMSELTRLDQDVTLDFELQVPRYAEVLPNGLRFFPLGGGRAYTQAFAPLATRKHDLVLSGVWKNVFEVAYTLPPGFLAAELPAEVKEESPFGSFRVAYSMQGEKLIAQAELTLAVARVKAAEYPAFRAWLGKADQLFSRKLVVQRAAGEKSAALER